MSRDPSSKLLMFSAFAIGGLMVMSLFLGINNGVYLQGLYWTPLWVFLYPLSCIISCVIGAIIANKLTNRLKDTVKSNTYAEKILMVLLALDFLCFLIGYTSAFFSILITIAIYPFLGAYVVLRSYLKLWTRDIIGKIISIALTVLFYVSELILIFILASMFR